MGNYSLSVLEILIVLFGSTICSEGLSLFCLLQAIYFLMGRSVVHNQDTFTWQKALLSTLLGYNVMLCDGRGR
jgi:hypothetical protein